MSRRQEIIYASADVYFSGPRTLFDLFYVFFLNQVVGVSVATAGVVYASALILRAITEPVFGVISDQMQTRWGKRKPFLAVGGVLALFGFIALWYPYASLNPDASLAVAFTTAALFAFVSGMMLGPYAALAPDVAPDYHARTRVSNIRHLFQLLAISAAVFSFSFFFQEDASLNIGYVSLVVLFAILFAGPMLLLLFYVPEVKHDTQKTNIKQTAKNLLLPLKLSAFKTYLIMNAAIETVLILLPVLLPFYLKFYLNSFDLLPMYAVVLAIASVITIVFFLKRHDFCKIKMFRLGAFLAAIGVASLYFVPENSHYYVLPSFILIGAAVAAVSSARLSMLTDLADVISKQNKTSMQAFVFTLAKGLAKVVAALVVVTVLSFSHIAPKEVDILPVEVYELKLLMIVPCLILLLLAFISAYFYRLNEAQVLSDHNE